MDLSFEIFLFGSRFEVATSSTSIFFRLTHNSQCCGLGEFASNTLQDLQFGSVQLTAANGAVS